MFSAALIDSITPHLPPNVKFWRQRSSWNTSDTMEPILEEISNVMRVHFPNAKVILTMDSAPIHLTRAVFRKAQSLDIWCLILPARTTYALQPLDTHVFSPCKPYLLKSFQDAKNEEGRVTDEAWAWMLVAAVREDLNAPRWARVFTETGLLGVRHDSRLTKELRRLPASAVAPPARAPSVRTLRCLWPTNRFLPYAQLLSLPMGRRPRLTPL